ncbi:hypothetical protein G6F56_014486 [Rhizopus delemar]|nr:hypothetical protein G6F56_014486 [Rhizopus delemar]
MRSARAANRAGSRASTSSSSISCSTLCAVRSPRCICWRARSGRPGCSSASSAAPVITAIGVRSSCETSLVSSRWRATRLAMRSPIWVN